MKTLYTFSLSLLLLLAWSACEKPLELNPTQAVGQDQLIVDAASANVAMNGLYSNTQDFFGSLLTIEMDLSADITDHFGTFPSWISLDRNDPLPEEFPHANAWTGAYALIYNANLLLEALPGLDAPTLDKSQLIGEARALRAWTYFYMANLYGDIPLVQQALSDLSAINVGKTPEADIYNFVAAELTQALTELVDNDNFKRISKAAVHTMLAKLHLMRGVWSEALAAADAVLSGDFQLVDNYMDLFDGSLSTEAIWQLDFNSNDGNQLAFHYNPSPAGRHEAGPSQLIVDAFATNDARRASIAATPNSANGAWQVTKYSDAATGSDQPILLRLADVLLIKAEALAELSRFDEATVLFNLVRERSVPGEPISLSANNFKNVILNERMLELAWEGGNRWLDMLRTSLGADYLRSKGRDVCKLKWPIPRIEVNTNTALEQGGCY